MSPATTPAITNDQTTAGPATGTASVSTKKIPVPTVAPTPIIASGNSPIDRASCPPPRPSAPDSAAMSPTDLRRKACCRSDAT